MIINPLNQLGGFIKQSTIGNAQRAGMSINRGLSGAIGSISGSLNYSNLRSQVQSFGAREIMDGQIQREQLKIMTKCAKRLNSFDQKVYDKIYRTYSSNPRKLKEVAGDIIQIYVNDITSFHNAFSNYITALSDSLGRVNRLDEELMKDVLYFLTGAEQLAEKGKFNLPPNAIATVQKKVTEFVSKQRIKLSNYASEEIKEVENVQRSTVGKVIRTSIGLNWIVFKSKRVIGKISGNQLNVILRDIAELDRQIKAEKLEIDFFPMVQEYLGSVDGCENLIKDFRKDIKLLFDTMEKDYITVQGSVAKFVAVFENEEGVKDLKNIIAEIPQVLDGIKSSLITETKDITQLRVELEDLAAKSKTLLNQIRELSEAKLKQLNNAGATTQILKDFATKK